MKSALQRLIRSAHVALSCRPLPRKLAIYFHDVQRQQLGAFADVIAYFQEQNYQFCAPDVFCRESAQPLIFLSFDDNFHSWVEAAEILRRYAVTATFYVNTCVMGPWTSPAEITAYYDRVHGQGDRTPLSSADLARLAAAGHTIASHGYSHQMLTRVPLPLAQEDIRRGKLELEQLLGRPVLHFSFPFGLRRHFSDPLRRYCFDIGFQTVASAIPGMQHCRQTAACIYRSPWWLEKTREHNLQNLRVDGFLFHKLTGRSAVG